MTGKARYSKRPWGIAGNAILDAGGNALALVIYTSPRMFSENLANGMLMALSPDLWEAITTLRQAAEVHGLGDGVVDSSLRDVLNSLKSKMEEIPHD